MVETIESFGYEAIRQTILMPSFYVLGGDIVKLVYFETKEMVRCILDDIICEAIAVTMRPQEFRNVLWKTWAVVV